MANKPKSIVSLTFDNFGDAFDLQNDRHAADEPFGAHSSSKILPEILKYLDEAGLTATFFIEGWNVDHYPDELRAIASAGHELALHGWCHEIWALQSPKSHAKIIADCLDAFAKLGVRPLGLRPPGGEITAETGNLLKRHGFTYMSSLGRVPRIKDGLVFLPFDWPHVDALYFEPVLAKGRKRLFGIDDVLPLSIWEQSLDQLLTLAANKSGYYPVIFHPYLLAEDEGRMAAFQRFITRLNQSELIETQSCQSVAAQAMASPEHWQHLTMAQQMSESETTQTAF